MTDPLSRAPVPPSIIGRLSRRLCSRRLVAVQLALLLVTCVAGVLIPQIGSPAHAPWRSDHPVLARLARWATLDEAFASLPFLALIAFLGVNLTLYVLSRLAVLAAPGSGRGWARDLFARRRVVGSLIFHAGLVGILLAAVTSALTRSEGNIVLTEGQVLALDPAHAHSAAVPNSPLPTGAPFQVRLDKFHPVHEGRFGTPDYASDLTVIENGREVQRATVRVNEPLVHRGMTFYQDLHGFSPLFVLTDVAGRPRFASYVALDTDRQTDPVRYFDDFVIPGTDLAVEAEFFPDAYMNGNRLASRSPDPRHPAVSVTVKAGEHTIYRGPIFLGQSAELGDGLRLGMTDVRYWSGLNTVRDRGAGVLFICAWIAIAGLCVRYLPQRRTAPVGAS